MMVGCEGIFLVIEAFELKYSEKDFDKQKKKLMWKQKNFKVNLSEDE